jgi:hypothetical protein
LSSRKGQVWTIDFTSGAVMLTVVLLLFLLTWNSLALRWNSSNDYRQMQTDALLAAEALVATGGDPPGWEMLPAIDEDSLHAMGLADSRNVLSIAKVERLVAENATAYYAIREKLGVQRYELGIRILDLEQDNTYYEFGRFAGGMDTVAIYKRLCVLDEEPVVLHVEVWE